MHYSFHNAGAIAITLLAIICSCQKTDYLIDTQTLRSSESIRANLSTSDALLSEEDAISVIRQIVAESPKTKAINLSSEECVVVINDANQSPAVYAVNMEDGFYLLSATKHHFPILAYVEHGHFPLSDDSGLGVVLDEMVATIAEAKDDPAKRLEYRDWWAMFEESKDELALETKATSSYSDYVNWLYSNYVPYWQSNGYSFYFLRNKPSNMPVSLYDQFCDDANSNMQYEPGYSPSDCAIILERTSDYGQTIGPYCLTSWSRGYPYSYGNLSTSAVAIAQVMKYHQFPSSYSWSSMPNNTSSSVLTSFLSEVNSRYNSFVSYYNAGETSHLYAISDCLNSYGYSVTDRGHSATQTISSIYNRKPVIVHGTNSSTNTCYSWVCDGYNSVNLQYEYSLLFPIFDSGSAYEMEEYESVIFPSSSNYVLVHVNWGDGGNGDGYFLDSNVNKNGTTYSSSKRDFYISK